MTELGDLTAFVVVARAGGFCEGARASYGSASSLSEAVRRLDARLGVRLLNRSTRSVAPTEAGARLLERLGPALADVRRFHLATVFGLIPWRLASALWLSSLKLYRSTDSRRRFGAPV